MALVSAVTDRWGVQIQDGRKVTWCELVTRLSSVNGHAGGDRVNRVEALLSAYGCEWERLRLAGPGALSVVEDAAIDLIVDVLHWMRAHGRDAAEALDRVQTRFASEVSEVEALPL
jgi:hypothetical protein